MSVGTLVNKGIVIQRKTAGTSDGMGGRSGVTWTDWVSDISARIQPMTGDEQNLYDKTVAIVTHNIYILPISGSDISAKTCRLVYGTKIYNIHSVINFDELDSYLLLECELQT